LLKFNSFINSQGYRKYKITNDKGIRYWKKVGNAGLRRGDVSHGWLASRRDSNVTVRVEGLCWMWVFKSQNANILRAWWRLKIFENKRRKIEMVGQGIYF